jgi:hypothetical protein
MAPQVELSSAFENVLEERRNAERLRRNLIWNWHTLIVSVRRRAGNRFGAV